MRHLPSCPDVMVNRRRSMSSSRPASAAAASSSKKNKKGTSGKKAFSFKSLARKFTSSSDGTRTACGKKSFNSKATFELYQTRYQKGDKQGELTGNVQLRAVPRYGLTAHHHRTPSFCAHSRTAHTSWSHASGIRWGSRISA